MIVPPILWAEPIDNCAYVPKQSTDNPYPELTTYENCGAIDEDRTLIVKKEHLDNMSFNEDGLACIYVNRARVFYVRQDGRTIESLYYDNGCDYFEEGLARGRIDGKIIFFNTKLEVVIETPFESALPFKGGYAAVCNGGYAEQNGEYTFMRGGACGYIDHSGNLIVPLKYSRENLPPIEKIKIGKHPEVIIKTNPEYKETSYTAIADDHKEISITTYQTDMNKGILHFRSKSNIPFREQINIFSKILDEVLKQKNNTEFQTLFIGRLINSFGKNNTEMSERLAIAAYESSMWDHTKGKPFSDHENIALKTIANKVQIFPELSKAFEKQVMSPFS